MNSYKNDFENLIDIIKLQYVYIEALQLIKNEELFVSIDKLELAQEQINHILPDVDSTTELKTVLTNLKNYIDQDLAFVKEFTSTSTPMVNSVDLDFDTSEEMTTSSIFSHIFNHCFSLCFDKKSGKDALISAKNQEIEDLKTKIVLLHARNKSLHYNDNNNLKKNPVHFDKVKND